MIAVLCFLYLFFISSSILERRETILRPIDGLTIDFGYVTTVFIQVVISCYSFNGLLIFVYLYVIMSMFSAYYSFWICFGQLYDA
jgi:hypothetical protein